EAEDAILSQLGETQKLLRELEKLDPAMAPAANAHETAVVELSEIARDLGRYAEKLDLDPEQLAALEQRVSLFESLKRKYGATISEVIDFGERSAERMRKIERRDAEAGARDRLERRNFPIDAGDQIRTGCAGCSAVACLRRD